LYDVLGIKASVSAQVGNGDSPKVEAGTAGAPLPPTPLLPQRDTAPAFPQPMESAQSMESAPVAEVQPSDAPTVPDTPSVPVVQPPSPVLEKEKWQAPPVPKNMGDDEGKASAGMNEEVSAIAQQIRARYGNAGSAQAPEPEPEPDVNAEEMARLEDETPEMFVSPDDPTIDQSELLGLNVVLKTFSGTVLTDDGVAQGGN
ncbi:MAG: hypothetical protein IKZ87_05995, partial [Actinomycetaceae bacterium]|nr:hypothetical protein [Actinomycetaceae bacterium]